MKILLALFFAACLLSCKKKLCCAPPISNEPLSLFFIVKAGNQKLPDSTLERMKLVYFQGGIKKYISDLKKAPSENSIDNNDGRQVTREVGFISGTKGIKDYYFEYADNTRDTLFIDYRYVTEKEAYNETCMCQYPLRSIKFNGQVPGIDSSYSFARVYILNRR